MKTELFLKDEVRIALPVTSTVQYDCSELRKESRCLLMAQCSNDDAHSRELILSRVEQSLLFLLVSAVCGKGCTVCCTYLCQNA